MTPALCSIFFVSGFSGLLFETLWFRQAGLVFGNSIWASSLVTASFMAGLALGNALSARHGDGLRRPLRAYAGLEGAVAASGLALVVLLPSLTGVLTPVLRPLLDRPVLLNGIRLGLAFVLLVVPATAMGATLPVLARALGATLPDFGRVLGLLYGWNTLGAFAGALVGETILIARLGLRGTGMAAAGLDLLAGAGALLLSRHVSPVAAQAVAGPTPKLSASARALLLAAFVAGGALLALEVIWFRLLLLFALGTSLTFAAMLATVLLGIGAGGVSASWWLKRRPDAYRLLPTLSLATGMACALAYAAFPDAVGHTWRFVPPELLLVGSLCACLTLPTCLLSGVLFTFMGKALKSEAGSDTRTAGSLTLANTAGAAAGALAGGFVLLPSLGMEKSLALLAAAYGVVAALAFFGQGPRTRRGEGAALALASVGFTAVALLFPFGLMKNHFLRMAAARWGGDGSRAIATREGLSETIIYLRCDLLGQPLYYRLVTNAVSMSTTGYAAQRYMRLFVWWPLALRPDARRALLISYGVGSTAQALTDTSGLESIDVVDISRDILEMSRLVRGAGESDPLADPRVRVHVEDGRFFLSTTDRRFDLITGEPPPPKSAGVTTLYSREYFGLMHDRLSEGGIATYWLPGYQLEPAETRAVIRAFCAAFADCTLWSGFGPEWMLAGSRGGAKRVTEEEFTRQWRDQKVGPVMRSMGLESPEQLGALFLADSGDLAQLTTGDLPLDDDHPARLSPRTAYLNLVLPYYHALATGGDPAARFAASAFVKTCWPEPLRQRTLASFAPQAVLERFCWRVFGAGEAGLPEAHVLLTQTGLRTPVQWLLGSSAQEERLAARAQGGAADALASLHLGVASLADRDYQGAEQRLRVAMTDPDLEQRAAQLRVFALAMSGELGQAAAGLRPPGRGARAAASPQERRQEELNWTWLETTFQLRQHAPNPRPRS